MNKFPTGIWDNYRYTYSTSYNIRVTTRISIVGI